MTDSHSIITGIDSHSINKGWDIKQTDDDIHRLFGGPIGMVSMPMPPHTQQTLATILLMAADFRANITNTYVLIGEIRYFDVFATHHTVRYCVRIGLDLTAVESGEFKPTAKFCPRWNCTDAECQRG